MLIGTRVGKTNCCSIQGWKRIDEETIVHDRHDDMEFVFLSSKVQWVVMRR
jgi:hypothetical protein